MQHGFLAGVGVQVGSEHERRAAREDRELLARYAQQRDGVERERLVERSARLGERLLERTAPLVEEHAVVKEARGLGLMWALEFAEPEAGSRAWRVLERVQPGLFAQLVVVPLFTRHRILSQVAGHDLAVLKILPPLVVAEEDLDGFVTALDDVIRKATRPTRVAGLALRAVTAR
jgi:4-aminobutyrate aminotransferase-like enzyme